MTYDLARHAERVKTAVESDDAAHSVIVASWRRCTYSYGLDPSANVPRRRVSAVELRESSQRVEPMLFAAGPTLDRLQAAVPNSGCCVLVAGVDGVLVHWSGKNLDTDDVRRLGLGSGVDWSEKNEGTNGVGTCLVEKRALTIRHGEHFLSRDAELTCSVAPIFDHEGQLAAVLDIAHYGNASSEGVIGLLAFTAREAAWQIEAANFRNFFDNARIITIPDRTRACVGLIAVDKDDVVLGATRAARMLLDITDSDLRKGIAAMDLEREGADLDDTIGRAERGAIRRALVRTGGNVSASARALDISRATMKRKLKQHHLRK